MPKPSDGRDATTRSWEYIAVDAYGACRQLHADCVHGLTEQLREKSR